MKPIFQVCCFFLVYLCVLLGDATAQVTHSWTSAFGGDGYDVVQGSTLDTSNNLIMVGTFLGTVNFDPTTDTDTYTTGGSNYIFIRKISSAGSVQWSRVIQGGNYQEVSGVTTDSDGAVYISGAFEGTVDFDPSAGTDTLTSLPSGDAFFMKLSSSGQYLWTKTFSGTDLVFPMTVAVDNSGSIFLAGYFYGTIDFDAGAGDTSLTTAGDADGFLMRYNADGTFSWVKSFGGVGAFASVSRIALDSADYLWVTGGFSNTVDLDPGAGEDLKTSNGDDDIYVSKFSVDGTYQLGFSFGGIDTDQIRGLAIDSSNSIFLAGSFAGSVNFDASGAGSNTTSAGGRDGFLLKYSSNGTFTWAHTYGGTAADALYSVSVGPLNRVYTTGYFQNSVDLDPGTGTDVRTSAGGNDIFVSALSGSGDYLWGYVAGGTGDDQGRTIKAIAGSVIVSGLFSDTVDFDPSESNVSKTSLGVVDIFTASITPNYTLSGTISAGSGLSGVAVACGALSPVVTNPSGVYSFAAVPYGTACTLTPSKAGYTFSPASQVITVTTNTTQDFTATLNSYSVSGTITAGGSALGGAAVACGALSPVETNISGVYSFAAVPYGTSCTLTPSKTGYTFSPASQVITVTSDTTQDFVASELGGCDGPNSGVDSDGDGVPDCRDSCPTNTRYGTPDICGNPKCGDHSLSRKPSIARYLRNRRTINVCLPRWTKVKYEVQLKRTGKTVRSVGSTTTRRFTKLKPGKYSIVYRVQTNKKWGTFSTRRTVKIV